MNTKTIIKISTLTATLALTGCGATSALMNHSSLDVNSKMSNTIFLDPIDKSKQTIYLQVKNTTSEDMKGLNAALTKNFTDAGWKVVTDQKSAYNMAQVNVLQAGEVKDPDSAWAFVDSGYGKAASAAVLGGVSGVGAAMLGASTGTSLGIGAGVGVASFVADSMITNKAYSVITDVQISVKVNGKVSSSHTASLKQGTSSSENQTYTVSGNWLKYQTRVGTVAQKVNLKFPDAKPEIVKQLGQQISGIFISNDN